jgi:hypothetical protein
MKNGKWKTIMLAYSRNNIHGEYRQKTNFVLVETNLVLIQITW